MSTLKFLLITLFATFASNIATQDSPNADSAYLLILGVGQDTGYPQVGCYDPHCMPGWEDPALAAALQLWH